MTEDHVRSVSQLLDYAASNVCSNGYLERMGQQLIPHPAESYPGIYEYVAVFELYHTAKPPDA
jgi:hypothetical protein